MTARTFLLTLALAASAGAAWGQTSLKGAPQCKVVNGQVMLDPVPCRYPDGVFISSSAQAPSGQSLIVAPCPASGHCCAEISGTVAREIACTHPYTPADLDRFGKVQGGGAPPTLTISDECKAIPQFSGASACICPDGHMIDVGQHCSDTSRPTRTYTLADLDRLRKVEWRLLDSDAWTPWQAKLLIEARVQTDVAAGVSVDELERRVGK